MTIAFDLRYAIRLMAKKPLFTAAMVLTLGICIGAVTAVFSVVDATLLRPLPFPDPERLAQVVVSIQFRNAEGWQDNQDGATWEHFSKLAKTLDLTVYSGNTTSLNFTSGSESGYIRHQRVGAGFFRVFGIPPMTGREFTPEEDFPDGPPVAVLSYNMWRRAFGADENVVGRTVAIAGV